MTYFSSISTSTGNSPSEPTYFILFSIRKPSKTEKQLESKSVLSKRIIFSHRESYRSSTTFKSFLVEQPGLSSRDIPTKIPRKYTYIFNLSKKYAIRTVYYLHYHATHFLFTTFLQKWITGKQSIQQQNDSIFSFLITFAQTSISKSNYFITRIRPILFVLTQFFN